ncbi:MAG: hypothetical protein KatS3mg104_2950 [Phycisphaerae bacterium]|nr:MAG: hypothetical protein KatS3mg104_2950 [Phycisphaerae bacterium]
MRPDSSTKSPKKIVLSGDSDAEKAEAPAEKAENAVENADMAASEGEREHEDGVQGVDNDKIAALEATIAFLSKKIELLERDKLPRDEIETSARSNPYEKIVFEKLGLV